MLRPGAERVARLGGLHQFMNWDRPILTDSGGYQVMSLSELTKVTDEGVSFAQPPRRVDAHADPERSIEMQRLLGSDIVMQFDELVRPDVSAEKQREAMERSIRWAQALARRIRPRRRACRARRDLRHPAGRARRGHAQAFGRRADRHRLRRLCGRRAGGGRGAGGDARLPRLRARASCRPTSRAT